MQHDQLGRCALAGIAVAALAALAGFTGGAPAAPAARVCPPPALAAGDVVFIGVDSALWARIASGSSSPDRRFGHVGVVVRDEAGGLRIVHASGSPTARDARVRLDAPAVFLQEADRIGLYRPAMEAEAVAAAALGYVGAPFDREFSLDNGEALYCTELVWRALSDAAHADALPQKPLVAGRAMITMAALEQSPLLSEIAFWDGAAEEAGACFSGASSP